MRRREFIAFVSGAAAAWPLAVRGQQPSLPLIGVLSSGPAKLREDQSDGLRRGLKEVGFAEGENLTILYRGRMIIMTAFLPWPLSLLAGRSR